MTNSPGIRRCSGISYVEVLVAMFLIGISLIPALEALNNGAIGPTIHRQYLARQRQLTAKMEEVLAQPFTLLDTAATDAGSPTVPSSFSDLPATPDRRLVYLSHYDGDNADADNNPFTGTDAGLIWVRVEMENTAYALESLTSQ